MLQKFLSRLGGNATARAIERLQEIVERINALESQFEALSDDALRAKSDEFRARVAAACQGVDDPTERYAAEQAALEEILPEVFAAVREASKRTIGLRHYDVQLMGGIVLHRGQIAEMRTGEGKTLVATLPLALNALAGRGAHLVTVNDYLARRDARWMGPIYHALGLTVGVLQMAAATDNGRKAYLYDPGRESPHEDQHHLRLVPRAEAYRADITYGTNSEFGFDYLRDNMAMRLEDRVQRGHYYAIVDEVDNVLIDEARTPLIISGPASGDLEWYGRMAALVRQLNPEDYEVAEKERTVSLTEVGVAHVERLLGRPLQDPDRPEDLDPEQARLMGYLEQALRAQFLYRRNKDYLVQGGKVVIVDEFTGRQMPGRRWSDGLHQAIEAKEGVRVEPENVTYATITLQNYFRMYRKLAGMTGTALTEAEEFSKIYKLEVLPIPTNLEYRAMRPDSDLAEVRARDAEGYEYAYFARRDDPERRPLYWRRQDYPDVIYRTLEAKLRAIVLEIVRMHVLGRPTLVGTTSVESSERLSGRLRAEPIRRLMQVLLARRAWFAHNGREEDGRAIPELAPLNEPLENLDPAFLRKFASSLQASVSVEEPANLDLLLDLLHLPADQHERLRPRLRAVLQGGVPHQVLNARHHTQESQIIAGAGAFGAVTIATNMAGRGVDIKLGGELAEEVLADVHRVLRSAGHRDPYDMSLEELRQAVLALDPARYGIYETEVKFFLRYFEEMEQVRALGGLHVIGSERHEARRIDNQLRGRAARQGDPGSSRFYLSLEDDLMRMFGGQQVSGLMERLRVDDSLPLEVRLVGNIIEQSQHRVEGANFDVRKHLLEYDDVLNKQREQIYAQRDRIFTKADLSEDIRQMLRAEVERRVPAALAEEEGLWRLLAWLEGVQPAFTYDGDRLYPSYGFSLLLAELEEGGSDLRQALLNLTARAIQAEDEHLRRAIEALIERGGAGIQAQIDERLEALDMFLEGLRDLEQPRRASELREELSGLLRMQLQLTPDQLRRLTSDPASLRDELRDAIRAAVTGVYATRLMGAIEHRLGEPLGLKIGELLPRSWDELTDALRRAAESVLEARRERLVGAGGVIARELDAALAGLGGAEPDDTFRLGLLISLPRGSRAVFDPRTHRQMRESYARFSFIHLAARRLEGREPDEVIEDVLEHLERAQEALALAWGRDEWNRLTASATRLSDLGPAAVAALGEARGGESLAGLSDQDRAAVWTALGRQGMNEAQRQLLLSAISDLWVDYLTRVEALRVSVGLEAYAQRDPLVQYKSSASQMFQTLMADIRAAVVGRLFSYRPRTLNIQLPEKPAMDAPVAKAAEQPARKKRKRH